MQKWESGTTDTPPRIRYWRAGDAGRQVLLIMGFGMRGDLWLPQIQGLHGDHQLCFYDHRGLGESEQGDAKRWTMQDMAQDSLRVMDAASFDSAHIVGVSMGGMIAQELALRAPDRVRSLTLIATHEGGSPRNFPGPTGLLRFMQVMSDDPTARTVGLQRLLYPDHYLATCDRQALAERMEQRLGRPARRSTLRAQLHAIFWHRTRGRLSALRAPTLVVKPKHDILIPPRCSDRLVRRIPNARLLELPDSGHGAIFQEADKVNQAIREHIAAAE